MIVEYHRPAILEEALRLLGRSQPITAPLGGGTALLHSIKDPIAVVDLQALGLDTLQIQGNSLQLGATLSLQSLLEQLDAQPMASELRRTILHEATYNLRQVATVAGTLVAATGRSPFTTALLALDAEITLQPGEETLSLGDLLPLRVERLRGRLITQITLPLNVRLAYEYVARTPADQPIVCAAAARWPSGRTRVALGGYGESPTLSFDGGEPDGAAMAARDAYAEAGDAWASAEYRSEIAAILVERCLEKINQAQER
jgi:CO/xanthine dehydrogenase FAD-binding subunit